MIDKLDNAILIDFGTSKQYDEVDGENTSTLLGMTPGYAPLEQIGNDVIKFTPATDIYALGATLYKLLTGITPASANLLASGEYLEPFPVEITYPTRDAIARSMEINKHKRPQNITAFLDLLGCNKNYNKTIEPDPELTKYVNDLNEDTQIFSESRLETDKSYKELKNWKSYLSERNPIVNIALVIFGIAALIGLGYLVHCEIYYYNEYFKYNYYDFFRSSIYELSIMFMCVITLFGLAKLFKNQAIGFWYIAILTPVLYLPSLLNFNGSDSYGITTYFLPVIIGFAIALVALYGVLHLRQDGYTAWSLMKPGPSWVKKAVMVTWALFTIITFAVLV